MTKLQQDATLMWLHLKILDGGVAIDRIELPLRELIELVKGAVKDV